MSSCFGLRKKTRDSDREPLLPQYEDDTTLQRQLHAKLHTYQQCRAISKGFMPSTEQIIINLRTLLASDLLSSDNVDLSESGKSLTKYTRQWLQQFMDLMQHKNGEDQIQDLIWFLSKSKISVDTNDIAARAKKARARADTAAAYQSLKTVGSLMLTNSDFRIFLSDLNTVGREVFKDSAFKLSGVAEQAGRTLEPPQKEQKLIAQPGQDTEAKGLISNQELVTEAKDVGTVVADGSAQVAKTAMESAEDKLEGDEGKTMLYRLKQAILKLRQRNDYSDSVSTLSLLIQRYAMVYSRAADEVQRAAEEDTHQNKALDRAMKNAWALITSFGDKEAWKKTEELWEKVMSHKDVDPQFENMMNDVGNNLQSMLTDPSFFDNAQERLQELRAKGQQTGKGSKMNDDVNELLMQAEVTFRSILEDSDIHGLLQTTLQLFHTLSPTNQATNSELIQDSINVFVPLLVAAVQYIPIPRLEVSNPDVDLLLENLIIEPGHTINQTSFLPYRLKVETYNDFELMKHKFRTASHSTNLMTIKLDGLSARADEIGFWLRAHSGLLRLADEGIASFALDDQGIDIHVDVEICQDRLEQILTLKAVRVHIHKLNYTTRKSKLTWFAWLLKPFLRPLLRRSMEKQLATALADFFHTANRELLFARERLRATRISNPDDLLTFFRAVAARLTPAEDPDLYTRVGITPPDGGRVRRNVFRGVYAPGSLVKLWEEEAVHAAEQVEDFREDGWRNEVFDLQTRMMT
ncbi:hypothetical protein KC340_g16527 [Hortaea werneckii]|nr:hypothetical protein KC342_g16829 [Hortaea werneckii]KAI7108767.1 hypothetical protein KC339_g1263 [Hortaea werneckii]KAI7210159.1 hypothetical protein KC365_g15400 [Hortaea werneckii]KAI7293243.1 hypothetical protein KC340_g16527 [Hortaea werneckii]